MEVRFVSVKSFKHN